MSTPSKAIAEAMMKGVDMPSMMAEAFVEELDDRSTSSSAGSGSSSDGSLDVAEDYPMPSTKRRKYAEREYIERQAKEQSNWYLRYLCPTKRTAI